MADDNPETSPSKAVSELTGLGRRGLGESLAQELGIGLLQPSSQESLRKDFAGFLEAGSSHISKLGIEAAVVSGQALGDWILALEFIEQLKAAGQLSVHLKLFELRCLVEVERFAEALALSTAQSWTAQDLIHVNYLTGLSFEGLGVKDQALHRFRTVAAENPQYRNISKKLLN